ncbi:MAG: hypothetical protein AB9903_10160 [Vulcanimicrobiota bacterium]
MIFRLSRIRYRRRNSSGIHIIARVWICPNWVKRNGLKEKIRPLTRDA